MHVIQEPMNKIRLVGVRKSLVIIGYFDGLHPLHQTVLETGIEVAKRQNLPVVLVTFSKKLKKSDATVTDDLMNNNAKIEFVEKKFRHVNFYVEIKILEKTATIKAQEFMQWLKKALKATKIVEGEDFTFGHGGAGTVEDLKQFFGEENVIVVPRNPNFSSTKIREALREGNIVQAERILGRELEVELNYSGSNLNQWQWNYPQTPLKPGIYHLVDERKQIHTIHYQGPNNFSWIDSPFASGGLRAGEHFFHLKSPTSVAKKLDK